jgi:fibronectin-binding autotransporter adhesin
LYQYQNKRDYSRINEKQLGGTGVASYTWKGVSGDWNDASDWTPAGGPPKASDEATINGTATNTVTVDTADVANSLTLSDADATLNDSASLTIGGTLTMSNGTLNDEAALTVGALKLSGGALTIAGQLYLNGTLSQTGGTLTLEYSTSAIEGGTIDLTAGTLTIDSGVIFSDSFTNSGTIDAEAADGSVAIAPTMFANTGSIDVANSETVAIDPTTFTTTSSSVIAIGANAYLDIDPTNAWTNLGSITLASGAGLGLYGSMSTAGLGSITNSDGTIFLGGSLNNSGQTLNGSASYGQLLLWGGTISGGTVTSAGVAFTNYAPTLSALPTLSGVTFDGPLNLTSPTPGQLVHLASGTTVVGSSGSGPGTINVTGGAAYLYFDNTQTVSNDTINLGNSGSSSIDYLWEYDTAGVGNQLLTLASNVTVDVQGYANIYSSGYSGDGVVNRGTIDQTGSGGALAIDPNAFTNSGTIYAEATSGSLTIDPTTFTNNGAIDVANSERVTIKPTVTGKGTDTISGDSTLEFEARVSSAKTLGDQDIEFTGTGTLHLLKPASVLILKFV